MHRACQSALVTNFVTLQIPLGNAGNGCHTAGVTTSGSESMTASDVTRKLMAQEWATQGAFLTAQDEALEGLGGIDALDAETFAEMDAFVDTLPRDW